MKNINEYIKKTWLVWPIFLIFLLSCWFVIYYIASLVEYFIGSWGMIITMPLYWYYIINPILDEMWKWFDDKYI